MTGQLELRTSRQPATSQATHVEANRAAEEIRAAVVVAQQMPRDLNLAQQEMQRACASRALAEKAFYEMPRAGTTIKGESIHLARELARAYGNFRYGVTELGRNDAEGYSEIMAWAWDVQGNVWNQRTFRVRHVGGKGGNQPLKSEQDIYTNNSNAAARRLRECIFAGLPVWFKDEAAQLCRDTITPKPDELAVRTEQLIGDYARGSVDLAQLERKADKRRDRWTAEDVADLEILFNSLKRREITKEQAFPDERLSTADLQPAADPGQKPGFDDDAWLAQQDQGGGEPS